MDYLYNLFSGELNLIKKLKFKVQNLRRKKDFDILDCFNEVDLFSSGEIDFDSLKKFLSLNSSCNDDTLILSVIKKLAPLSKSIDISNFYRIFEIYNPEKNFHYQESVTDFESQSTSKFMNW